MKNAVALHATKRSYWKEGENAAILSQENH